MFHHVPPLERRSLMCHIPSKFMFAAALITCKTPKQLYLHRVTIISVLCKCLPATHDLQLCTYTYMDNIHTVVNFMTTGTRKT